MIAILSTSTRRCVAIARLLCYRARRRQAKSGPRTDIEKRLGYSKDYIAFSAIPRIRTPTTTPEIVARPPDSETPPSTHAEMTEKFEASGGIGLAGRDARGEQNARDTAHRP